MNNEESSKEPNVGGGALVSGDVNTGGGDFVGRDKDIFLGRDLPTQQAVYVHGDVHGDVLIYPNTTLGRIGTQIERLRGRVTRLIPAEDAIHKLAALREPKPIGNALEVDEVELGLMGTTKARVSRLSQQAGAESYLKQLGEIEGQLAPNIESEKLSQLLQSLSAIADEVNIRIGRLNSLFVSTVYPATASRELAENMVSKIGHREYKDEAAMHLGVIAQLVEKLNSEELTRPNFDILSDEAYGAVGLMTELEKRRLVVERLVQSDRKRRNWTMAAVIGYICVAIALTIILIAQLGTQFGINQPLTQLRLPLLGIPWPIIVWSLIGSFAAMLRRFNTNPIYDFSDSVKWMITRPVQGVVLGSTFYLVLVSGLFILTAGNTPNASGLTTTNEVVLVLCFLVGFSDRFADSVFNTLVQRYSKDDQGSRTVSQRKS